MNGTCFLVVGDSGEDDDHIEWTVAAFSTSKKAEEWAADCRTHVNKPEHKKMAYARRPRSPFDPEGYTNRGVTFYEVREIPWNPEAPK